MTVMAIPNFERFFREAASIDVDKNDLKRYSDFVNTKLYDLLLRGQVAARETDATSSSRGTSPSRRGCGGVSTGTTRWRRTSSSGPYWRSWPSCRSSTFDSSEETRERLPELAGGISFALAQTFKIIDTKIKNPSTEHWERGFQLFDLLL
jgi:hypothetical protein